jgi:hypothetical protein
MYYMSMATVNEFRTKVREITNTTTADYSDASLIRDLNEELRAVQISILRDRGVLEFDDVNYTDLPVATFAVVAGQTTYKLTVDEDGNLISTIHKVAIDTGDGYQDVPRKTVAEGQQEALVENTTASLPNCYYEVGNSVVFGQIPAQSGTAKVWFDRDIDLIVVGDTTKVPGVPVAYHNLVAYRVAYNYALDKGLSNEDRILRRIQMEEARLQDYEKNRRADEATIIRPSVILD